MSTRSQKVDSQEQELWEAGADVVFVDFGYSSRIEDRPKWVEMLKQMRSGDTLIIRALDRIAGTERAAIEILANLNMRGIKVESLTEPFLNVDSSTPMGKAMVGFMAVLAELRVNMIRENTMRGLEYARSQGRMGGRPTVMTPERINGARALQEAGHSLNEIAAIIGVSKASVWRALSVAEKYHSGLNAMPSADEAA